MKFKWSSYEPVPGRTAPARSDDYVIEVLTNLSDIDAESWNALVDEQSSATPFMRHEYLVALQESSSACPATGWSPQFLIVTSGKRLVAACPVYRKDHSYGEYVFDWAWADAYRRHGLKYYPKLLSAVPFTPVPGPRLLSRDIQGRCLLLHAMQQLATQDGLSSAHVLFLDAQDRAAAESAGWMLRTTVQFHWNQRSPVPWLDFSDFLASLQRDKRKKIQQERRRVQEAGVEFLTLEGAAIGPDDWRFFYECYDRTYREHRSTPYLTPNFFETAATDLRANWVLFIAHRHGERIAASLVAVDPQRGAAFGRYWGAIEQVSCLHFEACYYQPLAWCIARGYQRFEGGAQGEHKMARGLLPVQTWSAHWLAHPEFFQAVGDFLAEEGQGLAHYLNDLNDRQPFKSDL